VRLDLRSTTSLVLILGLAILSGACTPSGDSYVAITEFSDPVRAKVLLTYGNASQPGSPPNGDQMELFSRKEMRDAWLSREDVEANLAEREEMKPAASSGN
jgi:hypothetical protein